MRQNIKRAKTVLLGILLFTTANASDLALQASHLFSGKSHTFTTISAYRDVAHKVLSLPNDNKKVILTDWDDTINSSGIIPGAWHQRKRDKSWVCETTKRMLLEHEVDGNLRDGDSPNIIQTWREQEIPVIVTTARPSIIDTHLITYAQKFDLHDNLMDARLSDNPDQIDYKTIGNIVFQITQKLEQDTLLSEITAKINRMSQQSGINLRGQIGIPSHHILKEHNGSMLTYQDGYAFVGHTKGPNVLHIIEEVVKGPVDLVIVDDSPTALGSYLDQQVIEAYEKIGYTLHLMHYPVEGAL